MTSWCGWPVADSGIVIKVLSNPHRSSVDLKTAIREIEELRNIRKSAPASLAPQAAAV